jgi:MFS family permease
VHLDGGVPDHGRCVDVVLVGNLKPTTKLGEALDSKSAGGLGEPFVPVGPESVGLCHEQDGHHRRVTVGLPPVDQPGAALSLRAGSAVVFPRAMADVGKKSQGLSGIVADYFKGFAVLKETRKEYWGLQVINFLDMMAYFALYGIVIVLLSEDFGYSDVHAGYVFTAFTLATTVCLWFSGLFTDWLGIRRTIYGAMIMMFVTRGALTWAGLDEDLPHRSTIAAGAIILMAPGMAMVQTMLQAANRRFTTAKSRGPGFNLWYLFMNVGAAGGGFLIDLVRKNLELPNSYIILVGVFTAVICMAVGYLVIRREEQLYGPDEDPEEEEQDGADKKKPWEIAWSVVTYPVFWRFMVLVIALLGVRAAFLYLHLLYPKYWLRVIGPEASIGVLQAINPVLVIIGLILLVPILHRFTVYGMLTYGAIISAISIFVMAIPSHGSATYTITILSLLVLTVGEIIWSPRLQEYTAAIAPKGQEGTYLGISFVPWFFAKGVVSFLSGHMLAKWVPEYPEGEPILRDRLAAGEIPFWESPSGLFIILGGAALVGPMVALLLKGWFTKGAAWKKDASEEEDSRDDGDGAGDEDRESDAPVSA